MKLKRKLKMISKQKKGNLVEIKAKFENIKQVSNRGEN